MTKAENIVLDLESEIFALEITDIKANYLIYK